MPSEIDEPPRMRPCPYERRMLPTLRGSNTASAPSVKRQAHELIDSLPESATREDVVYQVEVRASIEHGPIPTQDASLPWKT